MKLNVIASTIYQQGVMYIVFYNGTFLGGHQKKKWIDQHLDF